VREWWYVRDSDPVLGGDGWRRRGVSTSALGAHSELEVIASVCLRLGQQLMTGG
jgi:hypothetical protein